MSGDDAEETAPFTHRPYGTGAEESRHGAQNDPFASPPGPGYRPTPTWETYQQPVQPAYPPAPYGQMPYGYGVMPHPQANTAMILGIVALAGTFICGLPILLGPFAWVIGAKARREIDADPQRWTGRSEATVGFVMGIITTTLLILFVGFIVLVIGLVAAG